MPPPSRESTSSTSPVDAPAMEQAAGHQMEWPGQDRRTWGAVQTPDSRCSNVWRGSSLQVSGNPIGLSAREPASRASYGRIMRWCGKVERTNRGNLKENCSLWGLPSGSCDRLAHFTKPMRPVKTDICPQAGHACSCAFCLTSSSRGLMLRAEM